MTLTLDVVKKVNDYVIFTWSSKEVTYLSSDNTSKVEENTTSHDDIYTLEFLNNITASGMPNHKINFKIGVPIMLLCNID